MFPASRQLETPRRIRLAAVLSLSVLTGCASGSAGIGAEYRPSVERPAYAIVIPYETYDELLIELEVACIALGNPEDECRFEED